jgi:CopA family copper-resistance protein
VPALDKPVLLTMGDMGMSHGDHGGAHGAASAGEVDHSKMDHAAMGHGPSAPATPPLTHAPTESGPIVDMRISQAKTGLDDPGVGLRDNGRRVLTYADLATLGGPIDVRDAAREIELHLTGHMERYVWSFNGQKFSDATPLPFRHGERLRVTLVNDTMMTHPIHLHGMWSEVVDAKASFQVRKHTVVVNPAQRLSYLVTADALGRWAYHCHLLYHMEAGMFREVVVA